MVILGLREPSSRCKPSKSADSNPQQEKEETEQYYTTKWYIPWVALVRRNVVKINSEKVYIYATKTQPHSHHIINYNFKVTVFS